MVDVLAAGDRVLQSLHIDWTRKLSKWVAEDLLRVDCQRGAMWFWPILGAMDPGRVVRPLARIVEGASLPPGSAGLAAAYCLRIGSPAELMNTQKHSLDSLILALARSSVKRRLGEAG